MAQLLRFRQVRDTSLKLLEEEWKECLPWIVGLFVTWLIMQTANLPSLRTFHPALGTDPRPYAASALLTVIGIFCYVGILRILLRKILPAGNTSSYWKNLLWIFLGSLMSGIIVGFATLFFVIPGIWLGVSFSFLGTEIVSQKKGPWTGIVSSFELVKGRWWGVFVRMLMAGYWVILLYIFYLLLRIGLALLTNISLDTLHLIQSLLDSGFFAFVSYFLIAWHVTLYSSLRETPSR